MRPTHPHPVPGRLAPSRQTLTPVPLDSSALRLGRPLNHGPHSLKTILRRSTRPRCVAPPPGHFFDFPQLDAVVEVMVRPEGVVIRASRDCFSEERKLCFIRELAAEGFIDEAVRWRPSGSLGGVRWHVDAAAFLPDAACVARTRRWMLRLLFSAGALWLCLMGTLLLLARQ